LEEECISVMRADGWKITNEQSEVWLGGISGHLDGIIVEGSMGATFGPRPPLLEIKSPKSWSHFQDAYKTAVWTDGLAVQYAWQTSIYQHATGLDCVVATLDEGRVKTFVIEQPIHSLDEIQERVALFEMLVALGESHLREMSCDPSANSWFCQMSAVTGCRDRITTDDAEIDALVRARAVWKESLDSDKAMYDDLTKQIETALGDRDKVTTGYCTVTRYSQAGPSKWDTTAMEADGIPVEKYKIPGAVSSRLKITVKGPTDAES
jgi:hypothetical protein